MSGFPECRWNPRRLGEARIEEDPHLPAKRVRDQVQSSHSDPVASLERRTVCRSKLIHSAYKRGSYKSSESLIPKNPVTVLRASTFWEEIVETLRDILVREVSQNGCRLASLQLWSIDWAELTLVQGSNIWIGVFREGVWVYLDQTYQLHRSLAIFGIAYE